LTYGQVRLGHGDLTEQLKATRKSLSKVQKAFADLRTGLAELKPLVAPPRAARRKRTGEIRSYLDRDTG
jgi:hypothetical protein